MALADLHQHSLEYEITLIKEVHPLPPSSDTMSIYKMSISTNPLVSTINDGPSELSFHCFCNDEEILEAFLPEELMSKSD